MPKKILAVDDEKNILRLVEANLQREGYDVVTAGNGVEALQRVEEERPDLVVLDVTMPEMDGFEVLQALRAKPETRELPVIMLTAKAQESDVLQGWQSGVDMYLTKPFVPNQLILFVKRIFEAQSKDSSEEGKVIDLS